MDHWRNQRGNHKISRNKWLGNHDDLKSMGYSKSSLWVSDAIQPSCPLLNLSQCDKGHIQQTNSKHHSQWWKDESVSPKIRNKTRMATLMTIIDYVEFLNSDWKPNKGVH